jgi:adenylylsulfate kinase
VERRAEPAFAVWITGLPASGKSTLARALKAQLAARGVDAAVLESDALRKVWSDHPSYGQQDRDAFYRVMAYIGSVLAEHGVPVIFDATANLRAYRDRARREIPRFLEVYVECPLETCLARDPKGIYRQAREGVASSVPGVQAAYEPPENPDVLVHGGQDAPDAAAGRVIAKLVEKNYL